MAFAAIATNCAAHVVSVASIGGPNDFGGALVPAPPDLTKGAYVGTAAIFDEVNDIILGSPLHTDTDGFGDGIPGRYQTGFAVFHQGIIPAGTKISSFMMHFDIPPNSFFDTAAFSVLTDENIIGVIFSDDFLDAGDPIVGAPGTVYPTHLALRGATVNPLEGFDDVLVGFPADFGQGYSRSVYAFGLEVGASLDEVRVITAPPVPEPNAMAVVLTVGLSFAGVTLSRRRR